jgi:hypothetical protein
MPFLKTDSKPLYSPDALTIKLRPLTEQSKFTVPDVLIAQVQVACPLSYQRRHDIQHNDTQYSNTRHNRLTYDTA